MIIQIYSMTSIADAVATAEAGADLIGVVVAEPGVVPEGIEAAAARGILAAARPRARGVALSLADDRDEICAMVDAVRPDIVHIAAREITSVLEAVTVPWKSATTISWPGLTALAAGRVQVRDAVKAALVPTVRSVARMV